MGGRTTVYNAGLVTPEKWAAVCQDNKELLEGFLEYLDSSNKSPQTIKQYEAQLKIVFVYISEQCGNKNFTELKKRELVKFAGWLQNDLGASPNRVASLKAVISSLSKYIEAVLDDEYPTFRNISSVISTEGKTVVREKTVLTEEQIYKCLDALVEKGKYQVACFMALLYASGMRKGEAVQMRVDDFTPDRLVLEDKFYLTRKIRTKGRGKMGKVIPKYVIRDIFDPYLEKWLKYREENGIESDWLFVVKEESGYKPASVSTANSFANTIGSELGVPMYCHAFRHAWTTMLKRKNYPEGVIQKLQGWAGLDMVSLYSDISDEEELASFFNPKENN